MYVKNSIRRIFRSLRPRRSSRKKVRAKQISKQINVRSRTSVLGIYSVIAFSAALREQEMAIRMALGSQRTGILGLVFTSAAKLAIAGCALGLLGAAAASKLLRSLLFGVSPFDPLVLILAAVSVLLLALTASLLPARRAASFDPMKALRTD
jgi:ABC-type antimicrobial peptide transport system permease subunit